MQESDFIDSIPFLSFQQNRILKEHEADLVLWQGKQMRDFWPADVLSLGKNEVNKIYDSVIKEVTAIRNTPIDYSSFNPEFDFAGKKPSIIADFKAPETIMGRCPCPSESDRLRCCNLKTLDAVQQCAFACAYCSIQSFYSKNEIRVVSDLNDSLEKLKIDDSVWHIGTGQSSDSLLLGDDYGTLTALCNFARKHPDVIIELKTKCSRTDWLDLDIPSNIISTWSVNADTVCRKEEHLAASQSARIQAAAKCAANGHLVGFHIHPMVYFSDWKREYSELVKKICDSVDPKMATMVGIGTLTFTKANLKTLRSSGRPTRITQMPLNPIAGKYSYSLETKKELFSYVYSCFPQDWKDKVFFYLCMEDKDLWMPCLGREYESNDAFEQDMKKHYFEKVQSISTSNFERAKAKAHALPLNSGVYLMKDETGKVIYVGKAKSLRKRVSQYFLPNRDRKTAALVEKIRDIDHIITGNDYEALVLENNMIKKYSPHYNILLKDGKSYPVIKITKEDFPKVYKTRRIIKDGSEYYGPFPDSGKLFETLELIDKLFSLRKCSSPLKKKNQPCLYYHIGRCSAPCCGKADKEEYGKNIDKIRKFLKGESSDLENQIRSEMEAASKDLNYEAAIKKRDLLNAITSVSKAQMVEDYSNTESRDYAAIEMRSPLCTVSIMQFRDGKLIGKALYRAQTFGDESETLLNFLTQYYEDGQQIPHELYVSHEVDNELIGKFFEEFLHASIKVVVPKDGKDYRILRMAAENASRDVEKRLKNRDNTVGLQELCDILELEDLPELIEGFDIAQLNGKYTVASLISFVNGNPNPSGYRRFNIRSLNGAIDDYGAMKEAVTRRYTRVMNENLQRPDLVLIDGGKGQVNVARECLDTLGFADVPIVGLAEKFETIVFDDDRPDLRLDHSNEGLRILIAIRDECHRFATGANQAMRSKEASFRLLESIPGIGKATSAKIMSAFTTMDDIIQCSEEEIVKRAVVSEKVAKALLSKLRI